MGWAPGTFLSEDDSKLQEKGFRGPEYGVGLVMLNISKKPRIELLLIQVLIFG